MSLNSVTFDDLNDALDKFKKFNVHVVGDTIIDSYTNCEMIGGQIKTPTMSVKFESKKDVLGGAGIVAEHLRAAGASVKFTSVVGKDDLGKFTIEKINESGIKNKIIIDKNRPTTNKNAVVVGSYRLLKIDNLDNSSISDEILDEIISSITKTESDAVIFSDFRHGIFNKRTIKPLINSIPSGVFKVADSQVASRWGNILDFKGFDLITPNEREARFALADQDSGIRPLASQLYDNCDAGLLILKLGERGILTCLNGNHESLDSFIVMDSFAQHVVDPVGAGDALIAYSTLAMLATSNPIIASIIGNIAAGCECEHDGNIPIGVGEVKNKLDTIQKIIDSST
jgi:rfaE bifunctional protein kinase chain/domain